MPNAVVILGAGASADFGVPTLSGIFQDPYAQLLLRQDNILEQKLMDIFWGPRGHGLKTSNQSLTIEEMLTILRDWEQEHSIGRRPDNAELDDFRRRLYLVIFAAVFQGKSSRAQHLNPLIETSKRKFDRVTWASFNWDCLFESSFWYSSGPVGGRCNPTLAIRLDGWRDGARSHEYLKLHGSINWWVVNDVLSYLSFAGGGPLAPKWGDYSKGRNGDDFPVILEPSAYKYGDRCYQLLAPQWELFLQRLCEADCIIVIGYSLPEGDYQARSKILTSFQTNTGGEWLVVDPTPEICGRYRRLLGQQRVTILQMTLAGFNNNLVGNLQDAFPNIDFSDLVGTAPAP
jgi:hypothetical protein